MQVSNFERLPTQVSVI